MIVAAISDVEADSPRAHFINVVKTAGGFARLGHGVMLFCRSGTRSSDVGERFGEPEIEVVAPGASLAGSRSSEYGRWAATEAMRRGADFVYARSFGGALEAADAGLTVVVETHAHIGDANPFLQRALEATARDERPIAGLVTISHRLAEHYIARGADPRRVHIVPDGVDLDLFSRPERPADLGPSPMDEGDHALHVLYSGHLYDEKGIPTLIEAAPLMAAGGRPVRVHLLGGLPDDIERARRSAQARAPDLVRIHGPVSHAQVPRWLWRADCLVLPPSGRDPSANWTSPVKLGEYLAAGPPTVASGIPALRDWLDERVVRWFRPDDPADLARAVCAALAESPAEASIRRAHAMELARRFSYPARARAILRAGSVAATAGPAAAAS